MIDHDAAPQAPARKRGRPLAQRAPDGLPVAVRINWQRLDGSWEVEKFSGSEAALRLMCAWAKGGCFPNGVMVEKRCKNGWVTL